MKKKRYTKAEFQTELMNYINRNFMGNVAEAARHFDIERATLHVYLNDNKLERNPPKNVLSKLGYRTQTTYIRRG